MKPPSYTQLNQKYIDISKEDNNVSINESVPINSKFNIFLNTNNKNYSVKENKNLLDLIENEKNNYEGSLIIDKNKTISVYSNEKIINFNFSVIADNPPEIEILSKPSIINEVSLSLTSKTTDDYGVRSIDVFIKRPLAYKHFEDESIKYKLYKNANEIENNQLVESYFYKYLADIIWAGSNTFLEIDATD